MALISTIDYAGTGHPNPWGTVRWPYVVEYELNYADALTAKGSALAAADIIEVINIPANTVVLGAGARVKVAADSTTLTVHVGTGVDNDEWVASLDGKATAGTSGADLNPDTNWKTYDAADTIDVTLATLTGTLTTGKLLVYALMMDVSDMPNKIGIAQVGS